jgi:hypothetical protein
VDEFLVLDLNLFQRSSRRALGEIIDNGLKLFRTLGGSRRWKNFREPDRGAAFRAGDVQAIHQSLRADNSDSQPRFRPIPARQNFIEPGDAGARVVNFDNESLPMAIRFCGMRFREHGKLYTSSTGILKGIAGNL